MTDLIPILSGRSQRGKKRRKKILKVTIWAIARNPKINLLQWVAG
ncbi:MAG TPA: hypothetical protein VK850_17045 [Candidatus Binatia bacterium]|nr:hypothetical protein [Candidatus Binatia bacterium]